MKITGFRPLIVTKDQESVVKLFEELGFERRHKKTDIEAGANVAVAMKDANGKHRKLRNGAAGSDRDHDQCGQLPGGL